MAFAMCTMMCHTHAQHIECKYTSTAIISEEIRNMEDDDIRNAVINQLSNNRQSFSLKVSDGKYLFEAIPDEQSNGSTRKIGGSSAIYMDMNEKVSISQENILNRTFLIKEAMKEYEWDITTDRKNILERNCTKATLKGDSSIVAWFTTEIPVSFGPMGYHGLPGLIIQLETPSKQYVLQEINLHRDALQIEAPGKGKETSREEFEALKKKKLEELGVQEGSGTKIRVIRM